MQRRKFLRLLALGGSAVVQPPLTLPFDLSRARAQSIPAPAKGDPPAKGYGQWVVRHNLPAFVYNVDQDTLPYAEWDPIIAPKTRRNWLMVGNQAIRLQSANDGTVALFDETYGLRWLTAPDPVGTGVSVIDENYEKIAHKQWSTEYSRRAGQIVPLRTFGPTWFEVQDTFAGLTLTRTILCPEGEVPWVLVHVQLTLSGDAAEPRKITHTERWALRPRFLNVFETTEMRRSWAELAVSYNVSRSARGLVAKEEFASVSDPKKGEAAKHLIGPPAILVLERLADTAGEASVDGSQHPTLEIATSLELTPGETRDLWFRFGRKDNTIVPNPADLLVTSLAALSKRLPTATAPAPPEAMLEIPWHAAMLTGGVAVDRVIGGHSLNQASAYSYLMGFNGAARDPLQHALPLVYTQPDLALSVLRNTCAWAHPPGRFEWFAGELPYALDGAKQPTPLSDFSLRPFRPSDLNLWVFWLAAEYAAATGDLAAFDDELAYHPKYGNQERPSLREHLRRQFRYFVDKVGRGVGNHVRIMNADGNDLVISDSKPELQESLIKEGGSVLNSAMAAWVLSVFSALATRLGETALATEAKAQADELRELVRQAWNGQWYDRAYAPPKRGENPIPIGRDDIWLEVQPWAILCGAADRDRARSLLDTIRRGPAGADTPLGARWRWPLKASPNGATGDRGRNGIWYYVNMTLIWAAARVSPDWAWDQWRRMTLSSHTAAYPDIWEGTLSGPDSWNHPESDRPGRTWAYYLDPEHHIWPIAAMQAFPVNNMHSHAQTLLAYLRLLGVEPTPRGTLAVGQGGDCNFQSEVFQLDSTGHGSLQAQGAVAVETINGTINGGPGKISW
jgi:hypothetical protein